ncbi:MAG: DJ-1/PfpI family protein [Clostridium sp.]
MKVYVFIAEGFEDIEAVTSIDVLRRAGAEVELVSIMDSLAVKGAWGITINCDSMFTDVNFDNGDMVVMPGGGVGYENLSKHTGVHLVLKKYNEENKWIGAICAAPMVLGEIGLLNGRRATCYPGCEEGLLGANYTAERVTVDGNIITGRGPLAAGDFTLGLVKVLFGEEKVSSLKEEMIY